MAARQILRDWASDVEFIQVLNESFVIHQYISVIGKLGLQCLPNLKKKIENEKISEETDWKKVILSAQTENQGEIFNIAFC